MTEAPLGGRLEHDLLVQGSLIETPLRERKIAEARLKEVKHAYT